MQKSIANVKCNGTRLVDAGITDKCTRSDPGSLAVFVCTAMASSPTVRHSLSGLLSQTGFHEFDGKFFLEVFSEIILLFCRRCFGVYKKRSARMG